MELLQQIINDLVNEESSLNSALMKAKILAVRLGNDKLLTWLQYEISGYNNVDELPLYRRDLWVGLSFGFFNGNMQTTGSDLPTSQMGDAVDKAMRTISLVNSVSELVNFNAKPDKLSEKFRSEHLQLIETFIKNAGNPYFRLYSGEKVIPNSAIVNILTVVRNTLLDFMLEIEKEVGINTPIEKIIQHKDKLNYKIDQMINITNNGDGNLVNTGNDNAIDAKISIVKSNREALEKSLAEAKVPNGDIAELLALVDVDDHNLKTKSFGEKTEKWIDNMVRKAVSGTWQTSIGAAGGLLTEVLKNYLGM